MSLNLNYHFEYIQRFGILNRDAHGEHDTSDLHVSRIIESIIGQDIKRVERTGNLLLWNGYCWEERDNLTPLLDKLADTVKRHVKDIRRQQFNEPKIFFGKYAQWKNIPADDQDRLDESLKALLEIEDGIYKKLSTANNRSQLINMVASRRIVKPEDLDLNKDQIVFKNGCYNCKTGEFGPNDRDQNATIGIRYDYVEPDAESMQAWKDYLNGLEFDETGETIEYLQRSFGYAATGRGSEKRFWWFRGVTDTSKSTLIQIVANCLDQYAVTTMSSQWCQQKTQSTGHTEEIARLRARRLVTADEFEKNAKFNEALLKRMTAGTGTIPASRKGEKSIDFWITFALFFSSNYDCRLTEDDTAFINRLNTITFEKQIAVKDKQFVDKFLSTGKNRMAVLKWVMEGAKKYCESGIGADPAHVKESRIALLEEQVSINEQLQEILELNPKATGTKAITLSAVLEALSHLQKATRQHTSFSKQEVSKAITSIFGVTRSTSNGHSGYVGLCLKSNTQVRPKLPFEPRLDYDHFDDMTEPN